MQATRLNLGAGNKYLSGFINVDFYDAHQILSAKPYTLISSDCLEYLKGLASGSVSEVYSRHFLEHLSPSQITELLNEISRVCLPNAPITIIVPHWSNPHYYSDPSHKTPFGLYSASYWCSNKYFFRKVPSYAHCDTFRLCKVSIRFKSLFRQFRIFDVISNIIFNRNPLVQEFHEWYLSSFTKPYEVSFSIVRE